jgi:hypothetical protein
LKQDCVDFYGALRVLPLCDEEKHSQLACDEHKLLQCQIDAKLLGRIAQRLEDCMKHALDQRIFNMKEKEMQAMNRFSSQSHPANKLLIPILLVGMNAYLVPWKACP